MWGSRSSSSVVFSWCSRVSVSGPAGEARTSIPLHTGLQAAELLLGLCCRVVVVCIWIGILRSFFLKMGIQVQLSCQTRTGNVLSQLPHVCLCAWGEAHQLSDGFSDGVYQCDVMESVVFADLFAHCALPHCRRAQDTQTEGLEGTLWHGLSSTPCLDLQLKKFHIPYSTDVLFGQGHMIHVYSLL